MPEALEREAPEALEPRDLNPSLHVPDSTMPRGSQATVLPKAKRLQGSSSSPFGFCLLIPLAIVHHDGPLLAAGSDERGSFLPPVLVLAAARLPARCNRLPPPPGALDDAILLLRVQIRDDLLATG